MNKDMWTLCFEKANDVTKVSDKQLRDKCQQIKDEMEQRRKQELAKLRHYFLDNCPNEIATRLGQIFTDGFLNHDHDRKIVYENLILPENYSSQIYKFDRDHYTNYTMYYWENDRSSDNLYVSRRGVRLDGCHMIPCEENVTKRVTEFMEWLLENSVVTRE